MQDEQPCRIRRNEGRGRRSQVAAWAAWRTQHQTEVVGAETIKASHLGEEGVGLHTCCLLVQPQGYSCWACPVGGRSRQWGVGLGCGMLEARGGVK